MEWKSRIETNPEICRGRPRVKGTRLTVEFLLGLKSAGWSEQTILENYPGIVDEDLRAVFAFAQSLIGEGHFMPNPPANNLLVVCLCAAWCNTCTEFQATLDRIAPTLPGAGFAWLDIEDDCALIGEVEIENFPTLAVFRGDVPLFFGVTMPQEGVVARTLASLSQQDRERIEVPAEIARLPEALRDRLAGGKRS